MYKVVSLISVIIRQFLLPNPYLGILKNEFLALLFNIFVGGLILHVFSSVMTGVVYSRGFDDPAAGSAGYLLSYCYLTFVITMLGNFINNVTIFITVFLVIYAISCYIVGYIFNRRV